MKSNPYSMKPKGKPNIGVSPPKKQSLASILQKYQKDLCEEVMLRMNNELPIVQMIQAEKQKPYPNFCVEADQTKKTPWAKKLSNKENVVFEQIHTPVGKGRNQPAVKVDVNAFGQTSKSPLAYRPTVKAEASSNECEFVYKVKEGKMASLKDMLQGYSTEPTQRLNGAIKLPAHIHQHQSQGQHINQIPVTHVQNRGWTQQTEGSARMITPTLISKKTSDGPLIPPSDSQGEGVFFQPSFALNEEDMLQGLDLSHQQQAKVYDQIKQFQDRLISIFTGNSMRQHLSDEVLKQIRKNIHKQVRNFAKSLLTQGVAVGTQKSQAGCSKTEEYSSRQQDQLNNGDSEKNRSLFFSFESPISLKQDTLNQADEDQLNIAGLVPDRAEPVHEIIELGRPQNKVVSNVAMVVSKQMMDSKGSQAGSRPPAPNFQPAIRLDSFPWMKKPPSATTNLVKPLPDDGLGFRVDLNLNNSSDLELSHSFIEKKQLEEDN